jgi:hypothetical protein
MKKPASKLGLGLALALGVATPATGQEGMPWERNYTVVEDRLEGPLHVRCFQQGEKIFDQEDLFRLVDARGAFRRWQTADGRLVVIKATRDTSCFFEEQPK